MGKKIKGVSGYQKVSTTDKNGKVVSRWVRSWEKNKGMDNLNVKDIKDIFSEFDDSAEEDSDKVWKIATKAILEIKRGNYLFLNELSGAKYANESTGGQPFEMLKRSPKEDAVDIAEAISAELLFSENWENWESEISYSDMLDMVKKKVDNIGDIDPLGACSYVMESDTPITDLHKFNSYEEDAHEVELQDMIDSIKNEYIRGCMETIEFGNEDGYGDLIDIEEMQSIADNSNNFFRLSDDDEILEDHISQAVKNIAVSYLDDMDENEKVAYDNFLLDIEEEAYNSYPEITEKQLFERMFNGTNGMDMEKAAESVLPNNDSRYDNNAFDRVFTNPSMGIIKDHYANAVEYNCKRILNRIKRMVISQQ